MEQTELQRAIEAILFAAGERIETSVSLTSDEYRAKTAALAEEIIVMTLTPVLDYIHAQ